MFYCKKQFGQNFLIDPWVIKDIVNYINFDANNNQLILEIGPGFGAITGPLLAHCIKLIAIEIDQALIAKLQTIFQEEINANKLVLINQDVLSVDFLALVKLYNNNQLDIPIKIVGNLPYNISTEVLFKLLELFNLFMVNNLSMHFLLQKEVAERLAAQPGSKRYGRLSVMAQYHAVINIDCYVKSDAFNPVPKVESAMVKLVPIDILPENKVIDYKHFSKLVTAAFSQRRKTISNALKNFCSKDNLLALNIALSSRAEQLSVHDFVKISNYLMVNC